jgi:hypothetical protein
VQDHRQGRAPRVTRDALTGTFDRDPARIEIAPIGTMDKGDLTLKSGRRNLREYRFWSARKHHGRAIVRRNIML